MKTIIVALVLLVPPDFLLRAEPFRKVQEEVRERAGANVQWEKEMESREETSAIVQRLLKKPLTVSSAVQIALLNNHRLQATFEEVGIAQADVIEAVFRGRSTTTNCEPIAGGSTGRFMDPQSSVSRETAYAST